MPPARFITLNKIATNYVGLSPILVSAFVLPAARDGWLNPEKEKSKCCTARNDRSLAERGDARRNNGGALVLDYLTAKK